MNLEYNFLQKAIKDKNYISFVYENEKHEMIQGLSLDEHTLKTKTKNFEFKNIKKLKILKQRY